MGASSQSFLDIITAAFSISEPISTANEAISRSMPSELPIYPRITADQKQPTNHSFEKSPYIQESTKISEIQPSISITHLNTKNGDTDTAIVERAPDSQDKKPLNAALALINKRRGRGFSNSSISSGEGRISRVSTSSVSLKDYFDSPGRKIKKSASSGFSPGSAIARRTTPSTAA